MGMLGWIGKLLEAFEIVLNKDGKTSEEAAKEKEREKQKAKFRAKAEYERKLGALNAQIKKLEKNAAEHWNNAKKYALSGMEAQKKQELLAYQMLKGKIDQLNKHSTIATMKMVEIESGVLSSDILKASGEYSKLAADDVNAADVNSALTEINMAQSEIKEIDQLINDEFEKETSKSAESVDITVSKELETLLDSEIAGELNAEAAPSAEKQPAADNTENQDVARGLEELQKLMDEKINK